MFNFIFFFLLLMLNLASKVLENKRLDLDACKNKVRKARSLQMQPPVSFRSTFYWQADLNEVGFVFVFLLSKYTQKHSCLIDVLNHTTTTTIIRVSEVSGAYLLQKFLQTNWNIYKQRKLTTKSVQKARNSQKSCIRDQILYVQIKNVHPFQNNSMSTALRHLAAWPPSQNLCHRKLKILQYFCAY